MTTEVVNNKIDWLCKHTWRRSANNTKWCLIGCSIGDFGTIAYFQYAAIPWPTLNIMLLAIFNGLLTSIILETCILMRQSNEFSRLVPNWWGKTNLVGYSYHAHCWFFNAMAI